MDPRVRRDTPAGRPNPHSMGVRPRVPPAAASNMARLQALSADQVRELLVDSVDAAREPASKRAAAADPATPPENGRPDPSDMAATLWRHLHCVKAWPHPDFVELCVHRHI